jgi:hypothetical protein
MSAFRLYFDHCHPRHVLESFTPEECWAGLEEVYKGGRSDPRIDARLVLFITALGGGCDEMRERIKITYRGFLSADKKRYAEDYRSMVDEDKLISVGGTEFYGEVDYLASIPKRLWKEYYERATVIREQLPKYWPRHRDYLRSQALLAWEGFGRDDEDEFFAVVTASGILPEGLEVRNAQNILISLMPRNISLLHLGVDVFHQETDDDELVATLNKIGGDIKAYVAAYADNMRRLLTEDGRYRLHSEDNSKGNSVLTYIPNDLFHYRSRDVVYVFTRDEWDELKRDLTNPYTRKPLPSHVTIMLSLPQASDKVLTIPQFYRSVTTSASSYSWTKIDDSEPGDMMKNMMGAVGGGAAPKCSIM